MKVKLFVILVSVMFLLASTLEGEVFSSTGATQWSDGQSNKPSHSATTKANIRGRSECTLHHHKQ